MDKDIDNFKIEVENYLKLHYPLDFLQKVNIGKEENNDNLIIPTILGCFKDL